MRLPLNYTGGIDECVGDIDTIKNVVYYQVKLWTNENEYQSKWKFTKQRYAC